MSLRSKDNKRKADRKHPRPGDFDYILEALMVNAFKDNSVWGMTDVKPVTKDKTTETPQHVSGDMTKPIK